MFNGTQLDATGLRLQEDAARVGGMCLASSSVARLPSALLLGKQTGDLYWNFIDDQAGVVSECLGPIGQTRGRMLMPSG